MLWVFLTVTAGGLFWFGYRHPYRRRWLLPRRTVPAAAASAVDRQHRHLLAGGRLGESAVAAAAARFGELLRAGRAAEVEGELRAGVGFAVQVHALAAVGGAEAGRVLERQLARTLARDPVEQSWYWADVAAGLRRLHHGPALPAVLRCADAAAGLPAAPILAAEAIAFPNFPTALNDLTSPLGRAALRSLAAASRGCRDGVIDPECMVRTGLGDLLAVVAETAPPHPDPWLTLVVLEAERFSRRTAHLARHLPLPSRPLADRQHARLLASAGRRGDWLSGAPARLLARFPVAPDDERGAILRCAFDFRADVGRLFPHLPDRRLGWWADAVRCLTWSRSRATGLVLAARASRWLDSRRPARGAPLLDPLRGHPSAETEAVLVRAAAMAHPDVRRVALSSLGWWPPFDPAAVLRVLRAARLERDDDVRRAAVSALARLGERAALDEMTAGLTADEVSVRAAAIARVAEDEVSWLWPDLQELAESADPLTALAAAEAVERLRERVLGVTG